MKTLDDIRVNRTAKKLNRQLEKDVFGDRFYVRQVKKSRKEYATYYMYEFIDREDHSRTLTSHWMTAFEIYKFNQLSITMNSFIVKSDFWQKYREQNK